MSATNHTSNYNLPIYEAGNTANWLVDFNGAMSTIDSAMNENKLAGDTLKTDMEELQTDFQQVSTKADAAEQAATQASTNAANALTIANNATTIAGDAQVDAHAALTQIEKLTTPLTVTEFNNGKGSCILYIVTTPISILLWGFMYYMSNNEETKYTTTGNFDWFAPKEWTPKPIPELASHYTLENFPVNTALGMSDILCVKDSLHNNVYTYINTNAAPMAIFRTSETDFIPVWRHMSVTNEGERCVLGCDTVTYYNPLMSPLKLSLDYNGPIKGRLIL